MDCPREFADVIACTACDIATDKHLLRDASENVPQPGYIGPSYAKTRLLLIGQNPALAPATLMERDRSYTAALRTLREAPTQENYDHLQTILPSYIRDWPIYDQYFSLSDIGFDLTEIAYFNLVRCRTSKTKKHRTTNAQPNKRLASQCRATHCERWLDLLGPRVVVFIGLWAQRQVGATCKEKAIPHIAINRRRSLSRKDRAKNRQAVAAFVRQHIGGAGNT
jgi:uracil-DNA glycosylase